MKKTIYLDMDGVLANFDKKVKEFKHLDEQPWLAIPHFFKDLEVIGNPNETIRKLQELGHSVKILSKVETRDTLDRVTDKIVWVQKNIPTVGLEDIIIVPYHLRKIDFVETNMSQSILVDDYSENTKEWASYGGTAVKFRQTKIKANYGFIQVNKLEELLNYV